MFMEPADEKRDDGTEETVPRIDHCRELMESVLILFSTKWKLQSVNATVAMPGRGD